MKNDDDQNSQNRDAAYVRNAVGQPRGAIADQRAAIRKEAQRQRWKIPRTHPDGGEPD